jgi:hypothetical protein
MKKNTLLIFVLFICTTIFSDDNKTINHTIKRFNGMTDNLKNIGDIKETYQITNQFRIRFSKAKLKGKATEEQKKKMIQSIVEAESARLFVDGYKDFNFMREYDVKNFTSGGHHDLSEEDYKRHFTYLCALVRAIHLLSENSDLQSQDLEIPIVSEMNYLQGKGGVLENQGLDPKDQWLANTFMAHYKDTDWKSIIMPYLKISPKIKENIKKRFGEKALKTQTIKGSTSKDFFTRYAEELKKGHGEDVIIKPYPLEHEKNYEFFVYWNSGTNNECSFAAAQGGTYDRGKLGMYLKYQAHKNYMEYYHQLHVTLSKDEEKKIFDNYLLQTTVPDDKIKNYVENIDEKNILTKEQIRKIENDFLKEKTDEEKALGQYYEDYYEDYKKKILENIKIKYYNTYFNNQNNKNEFLNYFYQKNKLDQSEENDLINDFIKDKILNEQDIFYIKERFQLNNIFEHVEGINNDIKYLYNNINQYKNLLYEGIKDYEYYILYDHYNSLSKLINRYSEYSLHHLSKHDVTNVFNEKNISIVKNLSKNFPLKVQECIDTNPVILDFFEKNQGIFWDKFYIINGNSFLPHEIFQFMKYWSLLFNDNYITMLENYKNTLNEIIILLKKEIMKKRFNKEINELIKKRIDSKKNKVEESKKYVYDRFKEDIEEKFHKKLVKINQEEINKKIENKKSSLKQDLVKEFRKQYSVDKYNKEKEQILNNAREEKTRRIIKKLFPVKLSNHSKEFCQGDHYQYYDQYDRVKFIDLENKFINLEEGYSKNEYFAANVSLTEKYRSISCPRSRFVFATGLYKNSGHWYRLVMNNKSDFSNLVDFVKARVHQSGNEWWRK